MNGLEFTNVPPKIKQNAFPRVLKLISKFSPGNMPRDPPRKQKIHRRVKLGLWPKLSMVPANQVHITVFTKF